LVGGQFSVADIGVPTQLAQLTLAGEAPDAKRWPKLAAYLDRVFARPSFKDAIGKSKAMLGL
ncbi:MAG: glutathione binding-like protein, partial [Candidatus Binataceae bacterium]